MTELPLHRAFQYDAEFHFTIDVAASPEDTKCTRYYTIHDNGLTQDWSGEVCWCNPHGEELNALGEEGV
jgi:hypothetical protein